MVAVKLITEKTVNHLSFYGMLLAIVAAITFFFTTIEWSHIVVILGILILFRFQKVNINLMVTFSLFYVVSLFALQRYDTDKLNEIMMFQFLPIIMMIVFYFFVGRSGRFLSLMNKLAFYVNRFSKFVTKRLPDQYKKYIYIVVAILFSYLTIFTFQGFFGLYGGLIVLFSGFHIARFLLTKKKQVGFLYVAMFIYVSIYNLTLTHGLTLLLDDVLTYVYIYAPTIIIPLLLSIVYQREYLRY